VSSISYKDAASISDAGDALVERIKPLAKRTMRPEVLAGIGGFGALIEISKKFKEPVLVSGTDGVGTKLKLAFELNRHDSVGIDLVAMSVNDILVQGAEPLFFLDYFACGKLTLDTAEAVIAGIATGCEQAGCALDRRRNRRDAGMYPDGRVRLAGFAVGVVEKIQGHRRPVHRAGRTWCWDWHRSGAHSNGYSLIRKLIDVSGIGLKSDFHGPPLRRCRRRRSACGSANSRWNARRSMPVQHHVARPMDWPPMTLDFFDHADGEAGQIVLAVGIHAGHLGGFAADQRAAGLFAAGGDAAITASRYPA